MAFYYVKVGGTASGDSGRFATAQTGSFTSLGQANYYDKINDVFSVPTTPIAHGDYILVSHTHNKNYGSTTSLGNLLTANVHVNIVSVNDADIASVLAGAYETANTNNTDFNIRGLLSLYGFTFYCSRNSGVNQAGSSIQFHDSTLTMAGAEGNNSFNITSDGCSFFATNSTLSFGHNVPIRGGSYFEACRCTITSQGSIFLTSFTEGGGTAVFRNCDMTGVPGVIVQGVGQSADVDDLIDVSLYNCALHASFAGFTDEEFTKPSHRIRAYGCGSTAAESEYQFYEQTFGGKVEAVPSSGIHRDESTALPSGEKVSAKVTTNTDATPVAPFKFDLLARTVDLSDTASDVLTVYFASTATLTDKDVWVELSYPDGTNTHISNFVNTRAANFIGAGTTHTDDSGASTWKNGASDLTGHNEYRLEIDTSGDAGANSVPLVRICVGIPSTVVYFDTTIGVS